MISVDPGVEYYAWAEWRSAHLVGAGVLPISDHPWTVPGLDEHVVIEGQEVRTGSRARPNDIVRLAFSAGRVADRFGRFTKYHYWEWAGSLPEEILHKRIENALTPTEWDLILAHKKKDRGHIIEAVGLGLYHLRRTGERVQNQEANRAG